ncbi:MAG: flagellar biosynthesis regulatory protein FlaF [Rhodospirillales bacterium]|nr:MAG: flagellar biosynthesis regulatory protein FlaF [Rhodospirillales bacterium]
MSDAYSQAALAYGTSGRNTISPRQLEAEVLLKAARKLEAVRKAWAEGAPAELDAALLYNRNLWMVFADAATGGDSPLPLATRNAVANLAVFVFKRTVEVQAGPAPGRLDALIEINKSVAAGLLASPGTDDTVPDAAAAAAAPAGRARAATA